MIGRLDAPGAKLEPVMPGLSNNRSPSVLAALRLISSLGTTVTVANWSVTIGRVPGSESPSDDVTGGGARGRLERPARRSGRSAAPARAARSGSA